MTPDPPRRSATTAGIAGTAGATASASEAETAAAGDSGSAGGPAAPSDVAEVLARLDARLEELRDRGRSENTWRAYIYSWERWAGWAAAHHLPVIPAQPTDIARYLIASAEGEVGTPGRAGKPGTEPRPVSIATLARYLPAIAAVHADAGLDDPTKHATVRDTLTALRKEHKHRPSQAPELLTSDIERIIAAINDSPSHGQGLADVRDKALILLAFTSALRASELAALRVEDLVADDAGLLVHLRSSKTDQEGHGDYVGVPFAQRPQLDAPSAVDAWLERLTTELREHSPATGSSGARDVDGVTRAGVDEAAADEADELLLGADHEAAMETLEQRRNRIDALTGPVFRPIVPKTDRLGTATDPDRIDAPLWPESIQRIITRRARAAGLRPAEGRRYYSAHSTRAGFATQAALNGVAERDLMRHGRWKSLAVARRYIRRGTVWTKNPAGRLGL
ncbi:phage integrase family protein [Kineococcus xinjiangensis]|uniref:Phage integrase family protein n=1 Tax=Kineococcus xinjiangensis TaxID=512762 RepID=A0A2S6ICL1_9ACTN|nr:tyrosine-type recombinase/integrase [Kineococcus xinjiangensis]PPK91900.1 phage integrase family protein [Kineococcus xinjiangensis]